jgi:signal transduction histidine kinase
MGRDPSSTLTRSGLSAASVGELFLAAVVPEGLGPAEDARAREEAAAFLGLLLRHLDGDRRALAEMESQARAIAAELIRRGADPGLLLDRLDEGRHAILRALLTATPAAPEVAVAADDRLRQVQRGVRHAIRDAQAGFDAETDEAVAEVARAIEAGSTPDEVMGVAAAMLCRLVEADRARIWLETGGGRLELVASARGTAPMGFFVSAEQGVLADILAGGVPVRQCPVDPTGWEAALPNLPIPSSALFLPLVRAGQHFGLLYALRNDPIPFNEIAERSGVRFVERVEPALAWALQLRSLRRWAEASQDFLRFVTHELRRPLTVLRGYLDMLEAVAPDDAAMMRERMSRAADQLGELLTSLTDTVTLEDPVRSLDIARITLGDLVVLAQTAARDEAEQRGVRLVVEVDDGDATLECDVDNVVHALANLLSNAFRHTARQRRVWLSARAEGSRFIRFTVRDEGPGIAQGDQARIFAKYFRSDETRRAGGAGSGLGLYFVRLVAERHGGRVAAENLSSGGACFTLELPLEPGLVAWSL